MLMGIMNLGNFRPWLLLVLECRGGPEKYALGAIQGSFQWTLLACLPTTEALKRQTEKSWEADD